MMRRKYTKPHAKIVDLYADIVLFQPSPIKGNTPGSLEDGGSLTGDGSGNGTHPFYSSDSDVKTGYTATQNDFWAD